MLSRSSKKIWRVDTGKFPGGRRTQAWKGAFDKGRGSKGNFIRQAVKLQQREKLRRLLAMQVEGCHAEEWKCVQV